MFGGYNYNCYLCIDPLRMGQKSAPHKNIWQ